MSEAGPAMPWSSAQLAWLQAMGYTVYVDGALEPDPVQVAPPVDLQVAMPPEPAPRPAPPRQAPVSDDQAPPRRGRAPEAPETRATAVPPATARPARGGRRPGPLPDRLQMALLRASGCNPELPDTQALMRTWPLDELRGNPAAKRALWPTLRALRRKARTG